jgi:hypothetical protein
MPGRGVRSHLVEQYRKALEAEVQLSALLGYLNFSEGKPDARFQKQLSDAFAVLERAGAAQSWPVLGVILSEELTRLHQGQSPAFRDVSQATAVLTLTSERVLPAYRRHHADLLFHLSDAELLQPFFLARVFEAVLAQRGPWEDEERIVGGALRQLNDYVGHRPIAILESRPRGEPYDHERVRPIPLFIKGPGAATGKYKWLVEQALAWLAGLDPALAAESHFDPDLLDELALDPRGYDFDHPADKRTNYVFGEWDPHHIDGKGFYRRFVVRQVVLDGLLERTKEARGSASEDELRREAAAVLAGTMLMAAGVSGAGPETHDSSVTLSTLIPRIARYREAFYARLLETLPPAHRERLQAEQKLTRQAFGAARQHLNQYLARHRAWQLQQRHLAILFAEIGYPEAARRQVTSITVASIRLLTEIHIRLTLGRLFVERSDHVRAAAFLPEIKDLLHRGIACGAIVDPWNILGFQGQYPRFTALEDSVRDHRIDHLVLVMDRFFNLYAAILSEGAAAGGFADESKVLAEMQRLAAWWDGFATVEVSDVPHVYGGDAMAAAEHVSGALRQWRQRGAATADLAFWRDQLEVFTTAKAFALVVRPLLDKEDYRAAMALLITWLGQADQVPLEDSEHSFHHLALQWMLRVCGPLVREEAQAGPMEPAARTELIFKFFDYLEANAEAYWNVPRPEEFRPEGPQPGSAEPAQDEDVFGAAYEGVTFQDSTDDEVESEVLDFMPQKDFDLTQVAEGLEKRLRFLGTLARLWIIATRTLRRLVGEAAANNAMLERLRDWLARARVISTELQSLLDVIHEHAIPQPSGSFDSLVEFDRRRMLKDRLLSTIIASCVDCSLAVGAMRGVVGETAAAESRPAWEETLIRLEQALWRLDSAQARKLVPDFLEQFQEPLLYVPLEHGGHARQILRAAVAQIILRALVLSLPRIGLVRETYELLLAARDLERQQPPAGPRVSEFDRLCQAGCQATVDAVLDAAARENTPPEQVAAALEDIIEPFLALWLEHSKSLSLSVLERIQDEKEWDELCTFIRNYGHDLFHDRFLTVGNLRGILARGIGPYLDYLRDNPDPLHPIRLLDDLDRKLPRSDAESYLEIILRAVLEGFDEYRDYNATTTQSDYGENLYQFLDFLRLKVSYERNAWQLRILGLVHETLARRHSPAATVWRKQVEELTRELADQHLNRLAQLTKENGMHLRTISDRLHERFVKPLEIDQLCSLVEPAMDQARELPGSSPLEDALKPFVDQPSGAGLDVPPWLQRLEVEVQRVRATRTDLARLAETFFPIPKMAFRLDELREQMKGWDQED